MRVDESMKRVVSAGVAGFVIGLLGAYVFVVYEPLHHSAPTPEDVRPLEGADPLTLGQFYFNHDEDPTGPYDLGEARKYYREALDENENIPLAWYQLGRIDFLEGSYNAALWRFEELIERFGDEIPNVYYMVGLTYGYKARETNFPEDWQRAEEGFKAAIEYFPLEPWPIVDLAWIYFAQGKYEEMHELLETSLDEHRGNAWYLNAFGLSLLHTGEREAAHEYFNSAAEEAAKLTTEDWGISYPGNDPGSWEKGLTEMRESIAHNIEITRPE